MSDLSPEKKRALLLERTIEDVAKTTSAVMQTRWNYGPHQGRRGTVEEHHDFALEATRDVMTALMPDHEDRAREIHSLLRWPTPHHGFEQPFGPKPTFEKLVGQVCPTCGGTGVTGFLVGRRCFDC